MQKFIYLTLQFIFLFSSAQAVKETAWQCIASIDWLHLSENSVDKACHDLCQDWYCRIKVGPNAEWHPGKKTDTVKLGKITYSNRVGSYLAPGNQTLYCDCSATVESKLPIKDE